jgi:hypothetical protein
MLEDDRGQTRRGMSRFLKMAAIDKIMICVGRVRGM